MAEQRVGRKMKSMKSLPHRSEAVLRYILEREAERIPERTFLLFENGEEWTYWEGLVNAHKAANVLAQAGIRRGDHVLIFLPNGQDWIRAWWGIAFLGGIVVQVNLAYKGNMLKHICRDSSSKAIITSSELAGRITVLGLNLDIIDSAILIDGSGTATELDPPIEPWDTSLIAYTSGTTGPSKGCITTYFKNYSDVQTMWITGAKATQDDTMLVDLPLYHVAPFHQVYVMLMVGGRVALRTTFSASRYWDIIRDCSATIALMVGTIPAFLSAAPPKPDDAENPLRVLLSAPLPDDPAAFMKRFDVENVVTNYGLTESGTVTGNFDVTKHPRSCGTLISGFEARIVDDHDIPLPAGEVGELIVRYDLPWYITPGYWQNPEETARAWRNGWFHTGDFLCCDEEGYYYFVDRKRDAIRRRGINIATFEVEREVMAFAGVREVACVAAPSDYGEDEVKVFIVLHEGAKFVPADLIHFLIPRMPYFMLPRFVEVIDKFSKTVTNRIKKYELRALGNSALTWDREAAGIHLSRQ